MLDFTQSFPGSTAPIRSGWYSVEPARRAHFDTTTGKWSGSVDDDASEAAHAAARALPADPDRVRALRWRGLTRRSAAWLAGEMVAAPAL